MPAAGAALRSGGLLPGRAGLPARIPLLDAEPFEFITVNEMQRAKTLGRNLLPLDGFPERVFRHAQPVGSFRDQHVILPHAARVARGLPTVQSSRLDRICV
jgi:hypothetical protein